MSRTKREVQAYLAAAQKALLNMPYTIQRPKDVVHMSSYEWCTLTKGGDLWISVGDDCCICTRFEDVERAKKLGLGDRLNPHSGKWNWMGGSDHEGDLLDLAYFQQALRKIL